MATTPEVPAPRRPLAPLGWAALAVVALLVHLVFWRMAGESRMTAGLVLGFYGSRLAAIALAFVAVTTWLWSARGTADRPPLPASQVWFGRLVWVIGFIALVVQAVLFQRNAMRLFFDRFALRLF